MNLVGQKIIIVVSEPWDFQTKYPEPFEGEILITNSNLIQIGVLLTKEMEFEKKLFSYLVCSCRYVGQTFKDLTNNSKTCNIAGLNSTAFDLFWTSGKYDFNKSVNMIGYVEIR